MIATGDVTLGLFLLAVILSPVWPIVLWVVWWEVKQWRDRRLEKKIRKWVER